MNECPIVKKVLSWATTLLRDQFAVKQGLSPATYPVATGLELIERALGYTPGRIFGLVIDTNSDIITQAPTHITAFLL